MSRNSNKLMHVNLSIGQWLYNFFMLQLLFIVYTLKGIVVLGIFPSIASLFHVFYKWIIKDETDLSTRKEFHEFYHRYFWSTNFLGGSMMGTALLLGVDWYVSKNYIQSSIFHTFLLLLIFIYLSTFFYLFPVFARYAFDKKRDYIKQAFYIALSSIIQTAAIWVALVVLTYLFYYIPFLMLFFGIPVTIGVIAWFALQGIEKAELMKTKQAISSENHIA